METLCRGDDLTETEAGVLFEAVFAGEVDAVRLGAILAALKAKGESSAEIRGAAKAMLAAAAAFPRPADLEIGEIVGTGGDGARTINISTTAALAAAGAGLFVAKHGNRAVSSLSGASDVLTALGVEVAATPEQAAQTLVETGFTFCFAPVYHPAMKFAAPVRRELGVRTIFNLLGPLTNPARPDYALIGVYDPALLMTTAETLKGLGVKRAFVVHGAGLDEVAVHGETQAVETDNVLLRAQDQRNCLVGYIVAEHQNRLLLITDRTGRAFLEVDRPAEDLAGGTPEVNARITEALLAGGGTPAQRDCVAANLALLILLGKKAATLPEAVASARRTLENGAGLRVLAHLREKSAEGERRAA